MERAGRPPPPEAGRSSASWSYVTGEGEGEKQRVPPKTTTVGGVADAGIGERDVRHVLVDSGRKRLRKGRRVAETEWGRVWRVALSLAS